MREFKIRASAAGKIMTNSRKKGELSKTCTSFLDQWVKEQIYGRRKEIVSKYLTKGIEVEEDSLQFAADIMGWGMLLKNDEYFNDDHCTGTPDAITTDHIIDVKNSWDCFTFPLFETEPNKDYYWQGQVYMHLVGRDNFKLIYTLMDTPEHLITKEAMYKVGPDNITDQVLQECRDQMTYDGIDHQHRIKIFEIKKDPDAIAQLLERVEQCREYIQGITQ